VAATRLEALAVLRELPGARVVRGGVGLARARGRDLGEAAVSCGLAGALRSDLATGTVLVPHMVRRPDGELIACDPLLVEALERAARRLGYRPEPGPLVTSTSLITGDARRAWARRGFACADMETGLIHARRLAAVRVVLDTPERELCDAWERPATALLEPPAWRDLPWLLRAAPRCARRAARVLSAALAAGRQRQGRECT
jgi:hypothetical protein